MIGSQGYRLTVREASETREGSRGLWLDNPATVTYAGAGVEGTAMTDVEWLTRDGRTPMKGFVRRRGAPRKFRLMACSCCRQNLVFMDLPGAVQLVAVAEAWAEGGGSRGAVAAALEHLDVSPASPAFDRSAEAMALGFCSEDGFVALTYTMVWTTDDDDPFADKQLVSQLRDVFGNPLHPSTITPHWLSWNDGIVPKLAQDAYDNRHLPSGLLDNAKLAILADALEEAGCDNAEIVGHLRGSGEHVRGCWVVDLLLGKE